MKRSDYEKHYAKKLKTLTLFVHNNREDADGDPLHKVFPITLKPVVAIHGWKPAETAKPVVSKAKTDTEEKKTPGRPKKD